ncbi:MAG: hypothetical protein DMD35_01415 [Gemmatimonadetes bacterium]|nr:MAG: hypothetical protein DMD35_01415 [Gemmatimonadota bacterium]
MLAVLAVCGWLTRDQWLPRLTGRGATTTARAESTWQALSPEAGARGMRKIDDLSNPSGPVFTNLTASEVASYVFQTVARTIPASADSAEAAVIGDALYVRAVVPVRDIAGTGVLGPLGGLLNDRERLQLGGSFRVLRPGLSEFEVREIKLRDFKVPSGAIPRLLHQISRGNRPEGVAPNALAVTTPRSLADVRIANGRVTLYKTTGAAAP